MTAGFVSELKRRGVLGALIAYGVAAAGLLQLGDIVAHAMEWPPWTMRLLVWVAAAGLPITAVVSWFWDLTRHGFVRTQGPMDRPSPVTPRAPTPLPANAQATPATPPIAVSPQELRPGAVLAGRYRIERELGRGGMGRVLAATDARLGRRVAIKVVTGAHEPARVRRFEQEARTAGALEHPNVLAVYDLGEQDGVPFLVTELLDGHTMRTVLSHGPLSVARASDLALQLARGLGAAHARGVVHRDLKPDNLFLTKDGRLKILDFGLAKLAAPTDDALATPSLTLSGAIFGTPGYLSPEQARGEPAGPASDVFSAGAVIYEMLSGRRAFPGASLVEAGHAAITLNPPPLSPSVPRGLAAAVMRSLEKNPSHRFRDGNDLAHALETAGASVEPAAMPRTLRRSSAMALSGVALALGAALASAVLVGRHASRPRDDRRRESAEDERLSQTPAAPLPQTPAAPLPETPAAPLPTTPVAPAPPRAPTPPKAARAYGVPSIPAIPGVDREALARKIAKATLGAQGGMINGARALERSGQAESGLRMLSDYLSARPDAGYARLYRFILLRRLGRRAEAERDVRAYVENLEDEDWPAPLLSVYAGQDEDDDAVEAARSSPDKEEKPSHLCEAYFYLGLLHETDSPPDLREARRYFEKAISLETHDSEAEWARQELDSLERSASARGK